MTIIALLMLLAPGFISLRILWRNKPLSRSNIFQLISDYFIYSFLTLLSTYSFMFLTYPDRRVSFSPEILATSHILTASFVVKYSFVALISALLLPAIIKFLLKVIVKLEKMRKRNYNNTNS